MRTDRPSTGTRVDHHFGRSTPPTPTCGSPRLTAGRTLNPARRTRKTRLDRSTLDRDSRGPLRPIHSSDANMRQPTADRGENSEPGETYQENALGPIDPRPGLAWTTSADPRLRRQHAAAHG